MTADLARARGPAVFTALGAAAAARLTRDLGPAFVLDGTPLPALCGALALAAAAVAVLPEGWTRPRALAHVALAAARLALPLTLTLAWTGDARELWAALAVWVALEDAWRASSPRAPLAPSAIAVAAVVAWTANRTDVAPGRAVFIGLVAASAAAWGAERREEARRSA